MQLADTYLAYISQGLSASPHWQIPITKKVISQKSESKFHKIEIEILSLVKISQCLTTGSKLFGSKLGEGYYNY